VAEPGTIPVTAYYGTLHLECTGMFQYIHNFDLSDKEEQL
jgi:hypothetical protein